MHDRLTTPERCAAVAAQPDPILRNLLITLSYHDIARALADRICDRNITWPALAAWASKQAGTFIRLEALPERFGPLAGILEHLDGALDEVSAHISEGNRKVYVELAPLFARFITLFESPRPEEGLADLLRSLKPGSTAEGGQDRLRDAFNAYWQAAHTTDPRTRAQWVLVGNANIGVHEQTRLQEQIESGLVGILNRARQRSAAVLEALGPPRLLRRALAAASWRLEQLWRTLGTEIMSIALPEGPMSLSRDVPRLPDGRMFPDDLDLPDLPALQDLLVTWDPTPLTVADSAAEDWSDLAERMHYILDLFRSRQQDLRILGAPFSEAQQADLRAGRRPSGPL